LWRYNVRRKAKIWLPVSANLLMLLLIIVGIFAMFFLIDRHLKQTVVVAALKSLQIEATTISEL
jgi:hypothetical protein